jgi:protease I
MARIAFVVANDFEDSEFRIPYDRLLGAGHDVVIVGRKSGEDLTGKKGKETIRTQVAAGEARAEDFDALVIPGGYSPDQLRTDESVVSFVRGFRLGKKPIAAVCHGPSLLIEADLVRGRTLTSWPSIRTDLRNAGASWVDQRVVEEGGLITSRNPGDLDAFADAINHRLAS